MSELLKTKLYIPRRRPNLVSRPRLTDRLNAGLDKKLTLISAPPGFGKTTLLSDWIPYSPRCVTWLSLDEGDNDPTKFWAYLISSLQELRHDLGEGALALLQSPQAPPVKSVLTTLINDISAFPDVFSTVLDDYQLIESQPIQEGLTFLIDHLPKNMHLVITTRTDPVLPLARLRVQDELNELRANDLRFTPDETAAFLQRVMRLDLSASEVAALDERTEGWIAGLQIAALSMQGRNDIQGFVRAFSGSHRHILGYLAEEVLNQQPINTLNFLLQTSILDRLCGPLCDAVTERPGGRAILENLEHANLFITPLDDEGVWFRYHHLFAEVLRLRSQQTLNSHLPEFHRRAKKWLEQNNSMEEAVNHALAAGDFDQAASLIEQLLSAKWQSGEIKTLQRWLAAIPVPAWQSYPRIWLVQAWVSMTVGDFVQGDMYLKGAEEALDSVDKETAHRLGPEVKAFRASYASLVQDPCAVELAQQALDELPADYWMRGMLVVFLGAAYYSAGDLDAALETLNMAPRSNQSTSGAQPHRVHHLAFKGTVLYAKGSLNHAMSLLRQAVDLAEPEGIPIPFVGTLLAYMSLSPVLYERGEIEEAEFYLSRCLELAVNFGSAEVQIYTLSLLSYICLAHNDLQAAVSYYDQIDDLLAKHAFSSSIMANVEYRRFILYLMQGNLAAAEAWVDAYAGQHRPVNPYAFYRLALPQLLIAQGLFDTANEELTALIQEAQETGHGTLLVKALVLQAVAFHRAGKLQNALNTIERALIVAEPEEFVRAFVDEGESIRLMLLDYRVTIQQRIGDRPDRELLRLLAYTDSLLAAFSKPSPNGDIKAGTLFEPLSARELDILRLIATGRTNQEIAEILVIALSTVKSHINHLYGKVGVHNRVQAISVARELGLLP